MEYVVVLEVQPYESLIETLISSRTISRESAVRAQTAALSSKDPLPVVLLTLGLVPEARLLALLSEQLGIQALDVDASPDLKDYSGRLSPIFLRKARCIPIAEDAQAIVLAMADPMNDFVVRAMELATEKKIVRQVASASQVERFLTLAYGASLTADTQPGGAASDSTSDDLLRLHDGASDAPTVRLVNRLIEEAIAAHASDIHLEPAPDRLRVRYRIDGALYDLESQPLNIASAVVSRVKVMAGLDISEHRKAQDGRIRMAVRGEDVDFRVATCPTVHGEAVVLRILDRRTVALDFGSLGFAEQSKTSFLKLLAQPHGIVLTTGPTGSGKTTTLYAALKVLNRSDVKILTIEDPIEYVLEGINQTQVQAQIDVTFASALRAFLRHDPDIMMVGEIRDRETAEVAVQAALTGHLVLSTLHTNDAPSAVTRLQDMGIDTFLICSTLSGVMAQRLLRTLCAVCRESYSPTAALANRIAREANGAAIPDVLFRPVGCPQCRNTGYRGRTSICEVLVPSPQLRDLILGGAAATALRDQAIIDGMVPMHVDGLRKVLEGATSLEELLSVVELRI